MPAAPGRARGRLAPSPTGFLHLGNAWAFWMAWLDARSRGGECVLRFEDIDPARARPEYAEAVARDLAWLGLDWDYGPGAGNGKENPDIFLQSRRAARYRDALNFLRARGLVYPCYCTRKELRDIAGAPHVDDAGAPYPGTCRRLTDAEKKRLEAAGRSHSLRLLCPEKTPWRFTDALMGDREMTLEQCGGDFALRRSDGVFAYQLAVVVDDITMGVTTVVRGKDIQVSTPRQLYLYSLFGVTPPRYAHLPLVTDETGARLAKRHASLTLASLRDAGVWPETILGWLAAASGMRKEFAPLRAREAIKDFSFAAVGAENLRLPPDPAAFFLAAQR
ncbi:MAG: tRNA glutamyl-Q(34) synthetase GluQRS [Deltaproteobacteria bacterium]|nr:tRNA glutamyl-Q(34) synthetase GluQRS [Deltaproteobacteria bacterium]